ncbi:MAG: sugar ABC transporter substrate-binding protein [Anaerolineae bacterium]|nr:sugar ABC transporter substrate-binding protein [Anaerolineae bacterium]
MFRRTRLCTSLLLGLAMALAGCAAPAVPTPVVRIQTVIVERPVVETVVVEKTVKETVVVVKQVQVEVEKVVTATPEAPTPRPEGAKTILRVGTGDSGEGLTPHQEIIAAFEAANPDILVQLEAVAGQGYYARLLTQVEAGAAPDIMQIGDDALPLFVERGAFLELDPFISGPYPLDESIYLPGLFEPGMFDAKLYLLPKDFSPLAIFYNKALFDQFGVPYPQDGWSWDDLLQTAQALTQDTDGDGKTDVWGIQLPASWTAGFEYWVAAAGGRLVSEDGQRFVGYIDSPEVQRALAFYASLYHEHKVAPPPADLNLLGGGNTEFGNGQAAMCLFGRWPQADYRSNPNIDLGVVGVPAGAERVNLLFWGGSGIYSGTENPEAAWRFLRFYLGQKGAEVWKDWALPTVASVAAASGLIDDPVEGVWFGELGHLAPRAYLYTPHWGETADPALRRVLELALIDPDADLAAALARAAQDAQKALEDQP